MISSGRVSTRLLPSGCAWSDKGSAIFVEDDSTSELFLLGYLNSALATYFMKRIVNTTATAHIGYIERLPYRRPSDELEAGVVERVEAIVARLQGDPAADISAERSRIDELILDLFEIRSSRETVLGFYETVGVAERSGEHVEALEAQAASE